MSKIGITHALRRDGFVLLRTERVEAEIGAAALESRAPFAATWNGMALDRHMADGGLYRRRRHAILSAVHGQQGLRRKADGPHWQGLDHDPLNGGVDPHFEPIVHPVTGSAAFRGIAG